jgi:diguanylate cyclase (GGDEF)-like protein
MATTGLGPARGPEEVLMADDAGPSSALVSRGPFGPYDHIAALVHKHYTDGFADVAVSVAAAVLPFVLEVNDVTTAKYLHYTSACAMLELGLYDEAAGESYQLLSLVDEHDNAWRAKALSVLGDAWVRKGDTAAAIDALAEAYALVEGFTPKTYDELSAAQGIAIVLGHAQLFEAADDIFTLCLASKVATSGPQAAEARVLVLQEAALLQATWGAALEIDGRDAEAATCYRVCLTRALAMMSAIDEGDDEMLARAEVMEAYVLGRLGEHRLAEARLWAATSRFNLRPELPEVLLAKLGLGAAYARDEQFSIARKNLQEAADEAIRKDRWVWSLTALAQLATVDVLEYGPHPAVGRWQALARETTQRLWGERESRFVALRDRMSLRALTVEADRLGKAALMDPLTGLGNRRLLDRRLRLATGDLCVVFVDVDHFKTVNDNFGHDVGDEVLIRVAGILHELTRTDDTVVRYGGDEFVLLIPGVSTEEASAIASRVHSSVAQEEWETLAPGLLVTVSVGLATEAAERALAAADEALLIAKRAGRDRVWSAEPVAV